MLHALWLPKITNRQGQVKIDFSQGQITKAAVELPGNIGKPEAAVSDSTPMKIVSAFEVIVENQIVRLDLKEGNAWWVSRLLALCTGATRAGSPEAIVFVGVKEMSVGYS
jgi:hypothetical protein